MKKQELEDYQKIGLDDNIYIQAQGTKGCSCPMIIVRLKDKICKEQLEYAVAKTVERYLHLQLKIVKKGNQCYYEKNIKPYHVVNEPIMKDKKLGKESGDYPWMISYYEDRLAFTFMHTVFDGTGGIEVVKTLLFYYFEMVGIHPSGDVMIKTLNDDVEALRAEEFERVLETYSRTDVEPFPEKKLLKADHIPKSAHKKRGERSNVARITINTEEMIPKIKHYETTPFAFLVPMISRAIQPMFQVEKPVIQTYTVVNYRNMIGSKTLRNCHQTAALDYDSKKMDDMPLGLICTAFRSMLDVKNNPDNVIDVFSKRYEALKKVEKLPYFLQNLLNKIGYRVASVDFSFVFSYTGRIQLPSEFQEKVGGIELIVDCPTQTIIVEVIGYDNELVLLFVDTLKDNSYLEHLVEVLEEKDIICKLERLGEMPSITYSLN